MAVAPGVSMEYWRTLMQRSAVQHSLSISYFLFFSCLFWVQAKWPKPLSFDEFSPVAQSVVTYSKQTRCEARLLAAIWHHLMKETFRGEISCIVLVQEFSLDIIYHLSKHSLDKTHAKHVFPVCVLLFYFDSFLLFFSGGQLNLLKKTTIQPFLTVLPLVMLTRYWHHR